MRLKVEVTSETSPTDVQYWQLQYMYIGRRGADVLIKAIARNVNSLPILHLCGTRTTTVWNGLQTLSFSGNGSFLLAGHVLCARPAGLKITCSFCVCWYIHVCASALIMCAIIMPRTLLPCNLTS